MTRLLSLGNGAEVMLPQVKALGETEPGDVFYLAGEPGALWHRHGYGSPGDYEFTRLDSEAWWALDAIGKTGCAVVVVHNTRKFCGTPAGTS